MNIFTPGGNHSDEVIIFPVCGKAAGHIDEEGCCGSHHVADVVVRAREGNHVNQSLLEEIAAQVKAALTAEVQ